MMGNTVLQSIVFANDQEKKKPAGTALAQPVHLIRFS